MIKVMFKSIFVAIFSKIRKNTTSGYIWRKRKSPKYSREKSKVDIAVENVEICKNKYRPVIYDALPVKI